MSFRRAARAALAARSRAYWMLVAVTLVLAGLSASCGNSSESSSASHNAYITFPTKGAVALLHLNDSTGAVSLGAQTPSVLGTAPTPLALAPNKKFLYVGNVDANAHSVSIFNVGGDGSLTQNGDATSIGAAPRAMAIDASGKYLLITTDFAVTNLLVFSLDSGTGAITQVGSFAANSSPNDLKISPTSDFVYVSNSAVALITVFSLDSSTGNLVQVGAPVPAGRGVAGLAIDPGGHFLYAANNSDATVSAFAIDPGTGALSVISGSPFGLGTATGPRAIAIDPSGMFLYVANQSSNNVSAFTIKAGTGELGNINNGTAYSAGTGPLFALAEPAGKILYVGNQGSTNISAYTYDPATGALTAVSGSPFNVVSAPGAMVISH